MESGDGNYRIIWLKAVNPSSLSMTGHDLKAPSVELSFEAFTAW